MQCYICGRDIGGNMGMCEQCKAERTARRDPQPRPSKAQLMPAEYRGAGFWIRLLGYIIDGYIISLGVVILTLLVLQPLFSLSLYAVFSSWGARIVGLFPPSGQFSMAMVMLGGLLAVLFGFIIGCYLIGLVYFVLFEASPLMGTPGKILLGLRVGDLDYDRISPARAVLRSVAKLLSLMPFGLGFALIGISPEKRALHDLVAQTRVFKGPDCSWSKIFLGIAVAVALALVYGFVSPSPLRKSKETNQGRFQQQTLSPAEEFLKKQFEADMNKAFEDFQRQMDR